jgi:hypothetical protein
MERPQAVTALGILDIAFGAIGVLGILLTLVRAKELSANPAVAAMYAAMYSSPEYLTWTRIHMPIAGVLSALVLVAGIGLLRLRPWARTASIAYGVVMVVMACVSTFMFTKFALPTMLERAAGLSGSEAMVLKVAAYFTACASPIGLIYPGLLIFFLTRTHVQAAFAPPSLPPPLA